MKVQEMSLSVSKERMQDKNYFLLPIVLSNTMGYADREKGRIVSKNEFKTTLKKYLKLSNYKFKTLIETFEALGIMKEEGSNYIFNLVQTNFVKLSFSTALYFLDYYSDFIFKIYCWLLQKYNLHVEYHYRENYFFNKKELLLGIGYSDSTVNRTKLSEALDILEKEGFIRYNHQYVGRPGKHGLYWELLEVKRFGETQVQSKKEEVQRLIDNNATIDIDTALRLLIPGTEQDVSYLLHNVIESSSEEEKQLPDIKFEYGVGNKDSNTGLYDLR